jgi:hypothetical protein
MNLYEAVSKARSGLNCFAVREEEGRPCPELRLRLARGYPPWTPSGVDL